MPTTTPSIRSIFDRALEIASAAERQAFLDEACGAPEIRAQVEALLAAHAAAGSFLESPPSAVDVEHTTDQPRLGRPGTVIGPYKLLQQIGEGGMGVVYMADQAEPIARRVALKIIKPGMDTRQVIARFEAERQALSLMDHPNIAKVLDAGTTDSGRPYFVMELVKGQPITQYCDERHLTPRQRLELLLPVCQAIQHAHQKGIIHRDIKPTNILVAEYDEKAVPKVIDFGVAKAIGSPLTEKTMFTGFGQIVGTLEYMSPEQAKVNQFDIDTRSDVYSLGVLLYELLTGSTPFDKHRLRSAAFDEMLRIIREEEPPKPSTRLSNVGSAHDPSARGGEVRTAHPTLASIAALRNTEPARLSKLVRGELDWIVMKALEKDRSRRYETASALAMDVQRYLADESVLACPPSLAYRIRKFSSRNRAAVLVALVIFLLLTSGAAGTTWGWVRALAEADQKDRAWKQESVQRQRADANAKAAKQQEAEALKQKRAAQEQASIAQAVTAFFTGDVLRQASVFLQEGFTVDAPPDPDLKVRHALDRASARISGRFRNQPRVELAIRTTIADTYFHVGDYFQAKEHFIVALRLQQELQGEHNAQTYWIRGCLGIVQLSLGDLGAAEHELRESFEGLRRLRGEEHGQTLHVMRFLGFMYVQCGDYAKAEPVFQRLAETQCKVHGREHEKALVALHALGSLYAAQARHNEAERLLQRVLEAQQRTLGQQHPETLMTLRSVAQLHSALRDFAKAESLFEEVLVGQNKVLGAEHPQTLVTLSSLARMYESRGEDAKAEPLHRQVLAGHRKVFGEFHRHTVDSLDALAKVCFRQGSYAEEETAYRELLAMRRAVLGDEHVAVAYTLVKLAGSLKSQGKFAEAEAFYREGLALRRKLLGPEDLDVSWTLGSLAEVMRAQKKLAEAEGLYREALVIRRKSLGPEHRDVAPLLMGLSSVLQMQQKHGEAEPLSREALAIHQSTLSNGHWQIAAAKRSLGWALAKQGKYEEAEYLLLAAYEEVQAAPTPPAPPTLARETLNRIISFYEDWGKEDKAAQWRAKLPSK